MAKEIDKNCILFTVDEYLRVWKTRQGTQDDSFARILYARFSTDGRTLNRSRIQGDLNALRANAQRVLDYVNTEVAHRTAADTTTEADTSITWEDLDELFDAITALFNKYYDLVHPGLHVDFAPVLPYGFERAFERMLAT